MLKVALRPFLKRCFLAFASISLANLRTSDSDWRELWRAVWHETLKRALFFLVRSDSGADRLLSGRPMVSWYPSVSREKFSSMSLIWRSMDSFWKSQSITVPGCSVGEVSKLATRVTQTERRGEERRNEIHCSITDESEVEEYRLWQKVFTLDLYQSSDSWRFLEARFSYCRRTSLRAPSGAFSFLASTCAMVPQQAEKAAHLFVQLLEEDDFLLEGLHLPFQVQSGEGGVVHVLCSDTDR
ncbi:hypothetical protein EYF80_010974 [Liparis tanakae]|uniref:Uncharacterized protein n=1 Tax=Liparis tanakae TaxID=230148 RepID=A0A4Z2IMU2_9TELE|nr:hypothetical protein EYF80_010974 [Liparis tanakae]